MLSYRHAFHVGNHADVLKHVVLVQLVQHFIQKPRGFWYIDTHAGAGYYSLQANEAAKLAEYRDGIGRLWLRDDWPPAVADYVAQVRRVNPDGKLLAYPGSPLLALALTREQDRCRLCELHPRDLLQLRAHVASSGQRAIVEGSDGFAKLKALLPPPTRRGLVVVDPPYEQRADYPRVLAAMNDALSRFAGGTYLVWYPLLTRLAAHELPRRLERIADARWLHVTLRVCRPADDGVGLHGSGIFVVNPPWTLGDSLRVTLPYLVRVLGRDAQAGFTLRERQGRGVVDGQSTSDAHPLPRRPAETRRSVGASRATRVLEK